MNVRNLCLAILYFEDSTGYEIRKHVTEGAYCHFVEASYGSIYPALAKLEADGLVTSREEVHPGRPNRKVYSITVDGRDEFRAALAAPVQPDVFRSPFLLTALCAELMSPDAMARALDAQVANMRGDLETIDEAAADSAMLGADWVSRFAQHTISASLDFIAAHRDELIAIAREGEEDIARPLEAAE